MARLTKLLAVLLLCSSVNMYAQNIKNQEKSSDLNSSLLPSNLDFAIGYAPKSPYHALKADFSANNFYLKRFGAYTSLEKGVDSEYFSFILGMTTYVHKSIYLWYGLGVYSHYDTKNNGDWRSFRKEIGVGFNPHKNIVVRVGWSHTVGTTFTIGYRLANLKKGSESKTSPKE